MTAVSEHLDVQPIPGEEDIAAALDDLSVPALMASVVCLTGDPSYVRGQIRPREFVMNEFQGKMAEGEKLQLRSQALRAISTWRAAGCPPVSPPDEAVIREIMDWIACEPVPDDYATMYMEEMDLAAKLQKVTTGDPRALPAEEAVAMLRDAWAAPAFAEALVAFDRHTFSAPEELGARGARRPAGDDRLGRARPAAPLLAPGRAGARHATARQAPDAGRRTRAVLRRSGGRGGGDPHVCA